ncbi:aldehyde dehydrogenase [Croceitalea rosinachiae]|uniref:Aldehyde dehydrogenase n=1 Tax=Croceitalea rosinachiae TaxID=3075596 RepID=A0ABU3A7S1_9FLAO|nr:aldehyde dehydrogenase [Croceitalea sp. F388]MDT0605943.1 aldehyde dehydrogenase [Croceitalea sp. F388]
MTQDILHKQKEFFNSGETKNVKTRKEALKRLQKILVAKENDICEALYADFKKPRFETLATETQMVLSELKFALKNIENWSLPKRVPSNLVNFPSADYIYSEPYGNVLIISPWNYPFLLSLSPLIGAIAAGNTVVIKPSEMTPNSSRILAEIIEKSFSKKYITVIEGGIEASQQLLNEKWNYIFFTGSTRVGKIVYQKAAEHLTPVTLELSGKNPCIVDETANIKLAAKRIVWGKFLNAGQTCIATDYILAHRNIKDKLVQELTKHITKAYGKNIQKTSDFGRIATVQHYQKLKTMIEGQKLIFGGDYNDDSRYIGPTLIDEPHSDSKIMQDEIFGPLLPIISYDSEGDIAENLKIYGEPLGLYIFSNSKKFQKRIVKRFPFGGGIINDTVMQITNKNLPFGGVGSSGIGGYHGKNSFDLFSHKKSIMKKPTWIDIPLRYPPYKLPLKLVKKMKHLF